MHATHACGGTETLPPAQPAPKRRGASASLYDERLDRPASPIKRQPAKEPPPLNRETRPAN